MGDCDTGGSAPSADCSSAPDTSTNCSTFVDPPPDYSTCVSHTGTESSNHHWANTDTTKHSHHSHPISEDNASEASPLNGIHHHAPVTGPILHSTASSAPFLDVISGSENRHDGHLPGYDPYYPQPSYNPSYTADRPTTPRPNVYGKKTIILKRTDEQNSARKKKIIIGLCIGLIIGSIVPIVTLIYIFGSVSKHSSSKSVRTYNQETNNLQYDGRVFNTPRHTTADPYLTDNYKSKYDDRYGSSKNSDPLNYPFPDDKYKDTVIEKPWKPKTEEDILREMGINVPDFSNPYEDLKNRLRDGDRDFPNPVIRPITMSNEMKDALGIPRDDQTRKPPIWK